MSPTGSEPQLDPRDAPQLDPEGVPHTGSSIGLHDSLLVFYVVEERPSASDPGRGSGFYRPLGRWGGEVESPFLKEDA